MMKNLIRYCTQALLGLVMLSAASLTAAAPQLEEIASSPYQWTGIAVSQEQRLFVNYPTWNDYPPDYKVVELKNGTAIAYPNVDWQKEFVCVQSVVVDDKDHLWILDPAKLRGEKVKATGARLYDVNLATNEVQRIYVFASTTALPDSYLNDVRIDNEHHVAYLTDSSVGAIIVLDLHSGQSYRALENIPEVKANVDKIYFPATGKSSRAAQSDGLELSQDKKTLYFTSLGGTELYSIPTNALLNQKLTVAERAKFIKVETTASVPTDGMILRKQKLYMANLAEEAVWEYDLKTGKGANLELSTPIRWADSFAVGPNNELYFTTSQLNYPKEERIDYKVYRLQP